ncbi:MAG TPA: hypothetical protein VFG00_02715 [Acidothermaceae bacterium]|nr:hypothetical protein [Acidothermaceae bacterium]
MTNDEHFDELPSEDVLIGADPEALTAAVGRISLAVFDQELVWIDIPAVARPSGEAGRGVGQPTVHEVCSRARWVAGLTSSG